MGGDVVLGEDEGEAAGEGDGARIAIAQAGSGFTATPWWSAVRLDAA